MSNAWYKKDEDGKTTRLVSSWTDEELGPILQLGWREGTGDQFRTMGFSGEILNVIKDKIDEVI
jgi:hypothetical protein